MLQCFYPDSYQDSAYSIDYEKLRMQGYEAIIYDIDNTLVCHGAPADERSIALIERLKGLGFSIMLLSNNKDTTPDTTIFIGDQIFTDIWGAKKAGIYSILVKPIDKKEEIQIVLKRYLEKPILYFYQRKVRKEESRCR